MVPVEPPPGSEPPRDPGGRAEEAPVVRLERFDGPVDPDDPHANFKHEVVAYTRADPTGTLRGLAAATGVPTGALARYALVKWAAEGSEALLALGPRTVERLWAAVAEAERQGTDAARLEAYTTLRALLAWLRAPLDEDPGASPTGDGPR